MFRYDNVNSSSAPKEKQVKHVCEVRKVTYYNRHPDPKVKEPIVSEGWEIVKEIVVSPTIPLSMPAEVVGHKTVENMTVKKPKKKQELTDETRNRRQQDSDSQY